MCFVDIVAVEGYATPTTTMTMSTFPFSMKLVIAISM